MGGADVADGACADRIRQPSRFASVWKEAVGAILSEGFSAVCPSLDFSAGEQVSCSNVSGLCVCKLSLKLSTHFCRHSCLKKAPSIFWTINLWTTFARGHQICYACLLQAPGRCCRRLTEVENVILQVSITRRRLEKMGDWRGSI